MFKTLEEKIDPKHTAVIVIDMQNAFLHEESRSDEEYKQMADKRGGRYDFTALQAIVPTLSDLLRDARSAGVPVIFVKMILNDQVMSDSWNEFCADFFIHEGTWRAEIYDALSPEPGDTIVTKHRFSAFINTDLDLILRSRGINTVVVTGVWTDVCVESTVRDAFMLDHYVVIPQDCVATSIRDSHEASLAAMARCFGTVTNADQIRGVWAKQKSLTATSA